MTQTKDNKILYFATAGFTVFCYGIVLLLGLAASGTADIAITLIFLAEASLSVVAIARLVMTVWLTGALLGAVYHNDTPMQLYRVCSGALLLVTLPDIAIAGLLLTTGLEDECTGGGGFSMLRLCPTDAERPMCIVLGVLWFAKIILTIATWRAARNGRPMKEHAS